LGVFLPVEAFEGMVQTKAAAVRRRMLRSRGAFEYSVTDNKRAPTFRRKSTANPKAE
jgi:hypothetical protein